MNILNFLLFVYFLLLGSLDMCIGVVDNQHMIHLLHLLIMMT